MAQEFDQIISLLEEIKSLNTANSDSLERLTESLTGKFNLLKNKNSASLGKSYYTELVKSIEVTYTTTSKSFHDIESSIKHIYDIKEQDSSNVLSKSIQNFFEKEKEAKTTLKALKTNLPEIKKDKNISEKINNEIKNLSHAYNEIVINAISDLNVVFANINSYDWENKKTALKKQIDNCEKSLKNLESNLNLNNATNIALEKLLSNIITNENLKLTQSAVDLIIEKINAAHKLITKPTKAASEKQSSKSDIKKLTKKTEEILSKTNDIKQALGKVTQNIDSIPDTANLEKSLQETFKSVESLFTELNSLNLKGDNFDINSNITFLKEDFSTIKNIVSDLNDVLNSKIKATISNISKKDTETIKDNINKIITSIPKKDEVKVFLTSKEEKEKEDINKLVEKTDELANRVENLPPMEDFSSAENIQNTEKIDISLGKSDTENDNTNYDQEFDNIYGKTTNIENWLVNSKIKNSTTTNQNKNNIKKDEISSVLKTTEQIVEKLETIATNTHSNKETTDVNSFIEKIDELKNELINANKTSKEELISKIEQINNVLKEVGNFNNIEDIENLRKDLIDSIQEMINSLEIKSESVTIDDNKLDDLRKDIIESQTESQNKIFEKLANINSESNSEIDIEAIRTEILNNQAINQDDLINKLSELRTYVENIVSTQEFSNFADELKDLLNQIISNTEANSDFESLKKEIFTRIDSIDIPEVDFSEIKNEIKSNLEEIKKSVDSLEDNSEINEKLISLSEYINNDLKLNENAIKEDLTELKELIASKKSEFEDAHEKNSLVLASIEKYFEQIKNSMDSFTQSNEDEIIGKILEIGNKITDHKTFNEEGFNRITGKLEEYASVLSEKRDMDDLLSSSVGEIASIKEQIQLLGQSFEGLKTHSSLEEEVKIFVSSKLEELEHNFEELSDNIKNGIQQGFTYNSELIEEKTAVLLTLIRELRHASTDNIELFKRLTVTDNKLMDIKQELELINTDVTSGLNSKVNDILDGLESVKEVFQQTVNKANNTDELKSILNEIHSFVKNAKITNEDSDSENAAIVNYDALYSDILKKIDDRDNKIRDFILTDIDSVIIKVDNIKEYITNKLDSIVPPNPEEMKELNSFVSQILDFKKDNKEYLKEVETSINENINSHHEELKSILNIALNNKEILEAIEELKEKFNAYFNGTDDLEIVESDGENLSSTIDDIAEIRSEFNKFTAIIENLSGQNTDIEYILNNLSDKIGDISSSGGTNFNFMKAFDLLTNDVNKLKESVDNVLKMSANTITAASPGKLNIPDKNIEQILNSVKTDWLDEIKTYLSAENNTSTLLNEISDKLNILSLINNSDDSSSHDVKNLLNILNSKVDILAEGDNFNEIQEIKNSLEEIYYGSQNQYNQNEEMKNIIENLNKKFDIILQSSDSENISSRSENIVASDNRITSLLEELNSKIDAIKESENLNDSDYEIKEESQIEQMLKTLNDKIDVLSEIDNIDTLDSANQIQSMLEMLNNKMDIIAESGSLDLYDSDSQLNQILEILNNKIGNIKTPEKGIQDNSVSDSNARITSLLETLNSKIDILAESDNTDRLGILSESDIQITTMLETLNHKIDILAETDSSNTQDENFDDIKNLILEQKDYIEQLEPSKKLDAFKRCLEELTVEVNKLSFKEDGTGNLQKTLKDMKESIMDAVVTIFNQVSFVEETEDIKDFVEEKTNKIAKNLEEVTKQIKQIASSSDDSEDYTYSMQDIETDLAKIRLALNDLQNNAIESQTGEFNNIADTLNRITYSVDALTQEEIQNLKTDITNLKDQTKQLLMSSDASFTTLNTDIVNKVDNVTQLLEKSNNSDKVMRQALIYMGEWIDSASESMNKISSNSDEILNIKSKVEELKTAFPNYSEVLNSIEEKFDEQQEHLSFVEKQVSKFSNIEARFEQQEERIDRLETSLEKILSVVEDIDNSGLMRKVDKIDKQLAKLSSNIEKLASYVD